jgi:hypothetical protein
VALRYGVCQSQTLPWHEEYCQECINKGQLQSFSGIGVQHQNAQAEYAIQTIMYMAHSFMVHSSLHWTDQGLDDILLWSFAVKHLVWLYNHVPNSPSDLTVLELLTKLKAEPQPTPLSCVGLCGNCP